MDTSNNPRVTSAGNPPITAKRAYSTPRLSDLGKVTAMTAGGSNPNNAEFLVFGCSNSPVFITPCMS